MMTTTRIAASGLALLIATPGLAQDDDVEILADWTYDRLYADGWSAENMFDTTDVVGAGDETIGDVENLVFSDGGELLGLIAQVGGFWDIGDTHVFVPWDEVTLGDGIETVSVPVTEETVDDYDVFGENWFDEEVITDADASSTGAVDDDLAAGPGVFKATDLIGDYAYLPENVRYGYIADIIVEDGAIGAMVTDATTYGRPGYYAYPYNYRGNPPTAGRRYVMPYTATQLDTIENFDYDQLSTSVE
jgi:hypothetical protein